MWQASVSITVWAPLAGRGRPQKGATKLPREAGRSGAGGGARDAPAPGTRSPPPPPRTPARSRAPSAARRPPPAPVPGSGTHAGAPTGRRGAVRPPLALPLRLPCADKRKPRGGDGEARSPSASRSPRCQRGAIRGDSRRAASGAPREGDAGGSVARPSAAAGREMHTPGPGASCWLRGPQPAAPGRDPQRPLPPAPAQGGPGALRGAAHSGPRASPPHPLIPREGRRKTEGGGDRVGVRESGSAVFHLKQKREPQVN
ncbi:basic proline-rich protein-like [Myotis myotis]|uniref:Uncharacterized protein n=1 Tax=Myotis myotis TaxID=51298 RepID=A0A7J7Z549_MYOMY|nr:basic proline-rich protein-like [Myotis myotis]KAF6369208.1 hypothetical protein mMyoMyo1_010590 [Myotis myotis]